MEKLKYSIELKASGYVELDGKEFYRDFSPSSRDHFFAMTFSTRQKNGLLMRQEDVKRHMRIEIVIEDGHLFYV